MIFFLYLDFRYDEAMVKYPYRDLHPQQMGGDGSIHFIPSSTHVSDPCGVPAGQLDVYWVAMCLACFWGWGYANKKQARTLPT